MASKVLIIGGTGFIGDYLVKILRKKLGISLSVIYKNTIPEKRLKNVEYFQLDAAKDFIGLQKLLNQINYLIILSRPDKVLISNIVKSNLKVKKIIYASTISIYPDSPKKQTEDSNLIPANAYEAAKIEEEKILTSLAKSKDLKLCIARLTNVYGDIKNRALIHWILTASANDTEFTLNNLGKTIRDFIFIEDVAKYLESLIFLPQTKNIEVFNVCTGVGFPINQVISEVEAISRKKLKIKTGNITQEKACVIGDNKKIIKATKLRYEYDLRSGLKKAYQNYLNK